MEKGEDEDNGKFMEEDKVMRSRVKCEQVDR